MCKKELQRESAAVLVESTAEAQEAYRLVLLSNVISDNITSSLLILWSEW